MTLRSAAGEVLRRDMPLAVPSLRSQPLTIAREVRIAERFGLGGLLKPPPDLDEIRERLSQALRRGQPLSRRDLKFAPLCIWSGEPAIAEEPDLLERLLQRIAEAGRRSLLRSLAAVYFRMFDSNLPGLGLVGSALARLVTPELRSLYEFHRDFEVFDPAKGPARVAESCIARGVLPQQMLRSVGLSAMALSGGFGAVVYREGMARLARQLELHADERHLDQAIAWTDEPEQTPYVLQNRILAETLLLPFLHRDPPEALKDRILDAVLERIGDPRTKKTNWVGVEQAADVAKRWLTKLALRQFLEIVDQVAKPEHWDYRRAFWMALFDKGAIQEAWVAFGAQGADRARRAFGKQTSFGRLQASWKQVEGGHAVLIMRIGDYVAIDWSHNGRCIIWPKSDRSAPPLYQMTYRSGDLAPRTAPTGGIEKSHMGSPSYSWQQDIARFIGDHTGYRLQFRDFQVR